MRYAQSKTKAFRVSANQINNIALEPVPPLEMRRYAWIIWYGKWTIFTCIVLAVWITGYYGFQISQPRYGAELTIEIAPQTADLRDVSDHWPAPPSDNASLNTQAAIMLSDRVLQQVVRQQGLLRDPEFNRYLTPVSTLSITDIRDTLREVVSGQARFIPNDEAVLDKTVNNLRNALAAEPVPDTHLLSLTARSQNQNKAAELANATAATFVAMQIAERDAQAQADIDWLSLRVAELRQGLRSQERAADALEAALQAPESAASLQLALAVEEIEQERATLIAMRDDLAEDRSLSAPERTSRERLSQGVADLTELLNQISLDQPNAIEARARLDQINRDADASRLLLDAFLERLQAAQVQRGLDAADARILAPATSGSYLGPRRILMIELAALMGLIAGVFIVGLRHVSRSGVLHRRMLAATTGTPVMDALTIDEIREFAPSAAARLRRGLYLANGRTMPQVILLASADGYGDQSVIGQLLSTGAESTLLVQFTAEPIAKSDAALATHVERSAETDRDLSELASELQTWRTQFELILIDAGEVDLNSVAPILATYADICLLTVPFATSALDQAEAAHAILRDAATTTVKTVLTGVRPRKHCQFARCYSAVSAPT